MYAKIFSTIGLVTDIIGVILLFMYGLPSKIVGPPVRIVEQDITDEEQNKNSFITKMSYFGLSLLILGFIFQLIGVWINSFSF